MIEYLYDLRVLITFLVIFLFYKWGTYSQNLHLKLGRKGPKPLPFIGNMLTISKLGMHKFDVLCRNKFGKIYPTYLGSKPLCVIADEELLKQILIKDFKCFTDRMDFGFKTKTTAKMLTQLPGKDWERVRNLITPTFTSGKLKKMSPLLSDCVNLLNKRLSDVPPDQSVDMKEFFGALTMDAIARTMFGMEINSQTNPNNLFIINAKKLFSSSILQPLRLLILAFPFIGRLLIKFNPEFELINANTLKFFTKNLQKAIDKRKMSDEFYSDFLALMLKAGKEEDIGDVRTTEKSATKYLSAAEIMAQSMIFLIAGYETTATALTFATYFFAMNPATQQELHDELIRSLGQEGEITYDVVMKMPLLDAAINETLRICPPAVRFDRQCTQDVDLVTSDGRVIHVTKGDIFTVPVYAIHTDPEIWPEPEKFDIHRFDQENRKDRSSYSFMPFGMGPRNCVGMRFALLEIKWALATILKNFELHPCDETPKIINFKKVGLSQPDKPIILKVSKRD